MGVDITAIIEFTDLIYCDKKSTLDSPELSWHHFGELNLGRNHELFEFMAGIRGESPIVPTRGLPANASYYTKISSLVRYIEDKDEIEKLKKQQISDLTDRYSYRVMSKEDISDYYPSNSFIYFKEDGGYKDLIVSPWDYGHSWLLLEELKEAYSKMISERFRFGSSPICNNFWGIDPTIAAMEALEADPQIKTRLVFWFDC